MNANMIGSALGFAVVAAFHVGVLAGTVWFLGSHYSESLTEEA